MEWQLSAEIRHVVLVHWHALALRVAQRYAMHARQHTQHMHWQWGSPSDRLDNCPACGQTLGTFYGALLCHIEEQQLVTVEAAA
jgi:hypothetical protein